MEALLTQLPFGLFHLNKNQTFFSFKNAFYNSILKLRFGLLWFDFMAYQPL